MRGRDSNAGRLVHTHRWKRQRERRPPPHRGLHRTLHLYLRGAVLVADGRLVAQLSSSLSQLSKSVRAGRREYHAVKKPDRASLRVEITVRIDPGHLETANRLHRDRWPRSALTDAERLAIFRERP